MPSPFMYVYALLHTYEVDVLCSVHIGHWDMHVHPLYSQMGNVNINVETGLQEYHKTTSIMNSSQHKTNQ